jgi:hypothetical protein
MVPPLSSLLISPLVSPDHMPKKFQQIRKPKKTSSITAISGEEFYEPVDGGSSTPRGKMLPYIS